MVACPMPFEEFIYETRWAPGSGWTSCIQGPALACRSWIPFYANRDELDDCELKENWNSDPAIPLVLGSGNGRPNEQFYRKDEFVQNLHLKEYRAAIGIDQPTLYLDRDRRVVGVGEYRMEKSTMSSFREFITAGDDMDAPTTEVFQTETDRVKYLHA